MTTPSAPSAPERVAAELVDLDRAECLRLLATAVVGRVVVTEGALPAAHPVAFVLDGEEVVFWTASGSKITTATRHKVVAFEVDEIDVETRTGWSVLGVGEAEEIVEPVRLASLQDRMRDPWVPIEGAHVLAIPLQKLTGRRLRPARRPAP